MSNTIISDPQEFPIQPHDIDTAVYMKGVLETCLLEQILMQVIKLCQQKGSWFPFTSHELNEALGFELGIQTLTFFWKEGHIGPGNAEDTWVVTRDFVINTFRTASRSEG